MMIKFIIVDDDAIVRLGLRSVVNWEDHGYSLIAEAENGLQALELYTLHRPDLILCDIKMPKMDGFELIKKIRQFDKNVKIVVLSYYGDVESVKEALKSGADDYILKTSIHENELLQKLDALKYERNHADNNTEAQSKSEAQNKSSVIRSLVSKGTIPNGEFELKSLDIREGWFYVIRCIVDEPDYREKYSTIEDRFFISRTLMNVMNDSLKTWNGFEILCINDESYILFLNLLQHKNIQVINNDMKNILSILNSNCKRFTEITFAFGISKPVQTFAEIPDAVKDSESALNMRFYEPYQKYYFSAEAAASKPIEVRLLNQLDTDINSLLSASDLNGFKKLITEIKSDFAANRYRINDVLRFARSIQNAIIQQIIRKNNEEYLPDSRFDLDISEDNTLEGVFCQLHDLVEKWQEMLENSQKYSLIIHKALKFIEKKYTDNTLSLNSAAAYLNVSAAYLSTLFKRELNKNFIRYIVEFRVEKACAILKNTNKKVYEICQEVGFGDEAHFIKTFCKIKGVTPAKYRS